MVVDADDAPQKVAQVVKEQLETTLAGFTLNLTVEPKKQRVQDMQDGNFEIGLTRWGPDYADPMTYLGMWVTGNSNNYGLWSNADSLSYLLTFPADDASLIDSAASLVHMMNLNTFTCGAFHVADANNVARLADDLRTTIQAKRWMCGFPDKLVIVTVGQSVFSVYGNEELVNTFRDKLLASYPTAAAVYDEAINA